MSVEKCVDVCWRRKKVGLLKDKEKKILKKVKRSDVDI